jgi:Putative beta-barrel porin-2, OmpL-like. bbp2
MDIRNWVVILSLGEVGYVSAEQDPKLAETLRDQGIFVETAQPGVTMSGFVDAGYTYNFNGGGTTGLGRPTAQDNTLRGDFNLNALFLSFTKALPEANELAAGFNVSLAYGEDASFYEGGANQDAGENGLSSDFGLMEAYAQFRVPVGNGLDFKVGKFGGLLGFEGAERAGNINITYGNLQTVIPGNPVGVMASYVVNEQVDLQLGIVNNYGGDDGFGVNGTGDEVGFTGAVNVQSLSKNASIQSSFHLSPSGDSNAPFTPNNTAFPNAARENELLWTLDQFGSWQPTFAQEKLFLGYWTTLGSYRYQDDFTVTPISQNSENWFGFALYSKYQFTDIFSLAGRGDYLKATDGQIFATANPDNIGNELFSTTLTAGFDLAADTLLRVEYRADWGADAVTTTDDLGGTAPHAGPSHLVAAQIVYTF